MEDRVSTTWGDVSIFLETTVKVTTTYLSLISDLPSTGHVDETEQLTEEIKRLLLDPVWTADASTAPGELTNTAHCEGRTTPL